MLLRRLRVTGLLSFGPQGIDLPLEPLNVLIGPNGSGKEQGLHLDSPNSGESIRVRLH